MKYKVKCPHCDYKWETKSEMDFISCPNCQRKIKREMQHGKRKTD
jgi:Zn finger protein HypA/HybF involved in hydrogenase expression